MKFTIAAIILASATAFAGPHDDLVTARQHAHAASTRVSLLELEVTIAERDIATARIIQDTATKQRNSARHAEGVRIQREAQNRAVQKRVERDRARADLHASAARVTKLERGGRASR